MPRHAAKTDGGVVATPAALEVIHRLSAVPGAGHVLPVGGQLRRGSRMCLKQGTPTPFDRVSPPAWGSP